MDQQFPYGKGNDDSDESYSDGEVTSDDEQGFNESYRQQDRNNDDNDDIIGKLLERNPVCLTSRS